MLSFFSRLQIIIFYIVNYCFFREEKTLDWVVGVDEIARNITMLKQILPNSYSVSLSSHRFYSDEYDFEIRSKYFLIKRIKRFFYSPILLAFLVKKSDRFFFIWKTGFMLDRAFELRLLRKRKKKIVMMFVGSDIRSPLLYKAYCKEKGMECYLDYASLVNPVLLSKNHNDEIRKLASLASEYADQIFSFTVDQISYITKPVLPWPYTYSYFLHNSSKFTNMEIVKIVHAPSNFLAKGTPLVRSAIQRLRMEGYQFDYVELYNLENEKVLDELRVAHIVLNQFYAFLPGLFGIEAMAHHCAVLQSADQDIEEMAYPAPDESWLKTAHWQIYDNLKYLLENKSKIKFYADNGLDYVKHGCSIEAARAYYYSQFKKMDI